MSHDKSKRFLTKHISLIVLIVIAALIILVLSVFNANFLTSRNLSALLTRTSEDVIIAVAMVLVIISGNIDLSVGSILAFVPCIVGVAFGLGVPFIFALIIGLVVGLLVGALNGSMVAIMKVPAFIATLATMTAVRSAVYLVSGCSTITTYPKAFLDLSSKSILGIHYPIIIAFAITVILWIFLNKTKYGRFIYAVGGSQTAARASGIRVVRIKMIVMMISAFCASIAGLLLTARAATISPNSGTLSALNAITAALIGGASMSGGVGKIPNAVVGVVILALIQNGLNMLQISSYYQLIISGLALIVIVGVDTVRVNRKQ